MQTTLDIDEALLRQLEEQACQQGKSLAATSNSRIAANMTGRFKPRAAPDAPIGVCLHSEVHLRRATEAGRSAAVIASGIALMKPSRGADQPAG